MNQPFLIAPVQPGFDGRPHDWPASTPFGKALVVGSGTYKGYSLYDITSDNPSGHPPSYGCPATAVPLPPGFPPGFTCTGPR